MENPKRDGAAGRLDMTLPKCWHDRIWNLYRSVVVFGNTPNGPAWFPPSRDGGLQGVLVVQNGREALKFVATVDPLYPDQAGGAGVQP